MHRFAYLLRIFKGTAAIKARKIETVEDSANVEGSDTCGRCTRDAQHY